MESLYQQIISKFIKIVFFALLFLLSCSSNVNEEVKTPLKGFEEAEPGKYIDLAGGRLYLPEQWNNDPDEEWPVTVILHGYGTLQRSMSMWPYWIPLAEELGIVLFFPGRDSFGWDESRNSLDTIMLKNIFRDFRKMHWVKQDSIQLFGISSGAIMALGMTAINTRQKDGTLLFDKAAAASGGFGYVMEKEIQRDPELKHAVPIPLFIFWGDKEYKDHGSDAAQFFNNLGWIVETASHSGGHEFPESCVRKVLEKNRK